MSSTRARRCCPLFRIEKDKPRELCRLPTDNEVGRLRPDNEVLNTFTSRAEKRLHRISSALSYTATKRGPRQQRARGTRRERNRRDPKFARNPKRRAQRFPPTSLGWNYFPNRFCSRARFKHIDDGWRRSPWICGICWVSDLRGSVSRRKQGGKIHVRVFRR